MNAATTTIGAMINRAEKNITFRLANEIRNFSSEDVKPPVVRSVRASAPTPPSAT
jgi:hypothetical protein